MTVVDSDGLVSTAKRNVYPKKVFIDIDTKGRKGLTVLVDDFAVCLVYSFKYHFSSHYRIY
jgi:hypothetical protein